MDLSETVSPTEEAMPEYQFDVAVSFLVGDEAGALEFRDRLAGSLQVFIYSKEQEQLSGTEGLESLREAFRTHCRLVLVLYRDGWGTTPWTRVEQTAITDRALQEGWNFLLFVTLDKTSTLPKWLPETRLRLSLPDYGIEQAVGAIKVRLQELGGTFREQDAVQRAQAAASRVDRHKEAQQTLISQGWEAAGDEIQTVIAEVARLTEKIQGDAPSLAFKFGCERGSCVLTTGPASLSIRGYRTAPAASECRVVAQFFLGRLLLPAERGRCMAPAQPKERKKLEFYFDFQPGVRWCWKSDPTQARNEPALLLPHQRTRTSIELADHIVSLFVSFAEKVAIA